MATLFRQVEREQGTGQPRDFVLAERRVGHRRSITGFGAVHKPLRTRNDAVDLGA